MLFGPTFVSASLARITPGDAVVFEFQNSNIYALAVDPYPEDETLPGLLCLHPKHPDVDGIGILSASAVGGATKPILLTPNARIFVKNPAVAYKSQRSIIPAGALAILGDRKAIVGYVAVKEKGFFDIENGRDLGLAKPCAHFAEYAIQAPDGDKWVDLAFIKASTRSYDRRFLDASLHYHTAHSWDSTRCLNHRYGGV